MNKNTFFEKVAKIDDEITITLCENGFMANVSYEDKNSDWQRSKIVFADIKSLNDFIAKLANKVKR